MEQVIEIRYLPLESSKLKKKITFMPENIFLGTNLYPRLHFQGFEAKQTNSYVKFFEMSHSKNLELW